MNTQNFSYDHIHKENIRCVRVSFLKDLIISEAGYEAYQFIQQYADLSMDTIVVSTTNIFNIDTFSVVDPKAIINLHKINDIRHVNKFFEGINIRFSNECIFIGSAESKDLRKERILKKYIVGFNYLYYSFDFILKRVFPKFPITKQIYFFLTKGLNRVMARAEILGRLYSCGFEVIDEQAIGSLFYFIARKKGDPAFDENPTYGPIISLKRVGKNGKTIKVYKIRTMHPYAEYLQDYVYKKFNLEEGGKFKNDFRVSFIGSYMRKLWIDELPMIWNLLKGDLKLIGVRPLSQHYFNLYSDELKQKRIKYKPGLIPPFYADLPKTLEDIIESELNYLNAYDKNPFLTDLKYFQKAMFNIFFKHSRSK